VTPGGLIDVSDRGMIAFKFDSSILDISAADLTAPGMGTIKAYTSSGWLTVIPAADLTNVPNTFSFTGMTNPPFNDPAASYAILGYT